MPKKSHRAERVRPLLTEPQWRALDLIYKTSPGGQGWVFCGLGCTSATARALEDIGAAKYEHKLMKRAQAMGRIRKRVCLTAVGRKLVELGPPEEITMRPGSYTWGEVRP